MTALSAQHLLNRANQLLLANEFVPDKDDNGRTWLRVNKTWEIRAGFELVYDDPALHLTVYRQSDGEPVTSVRIDMRDTSAAERKMERVLNKFSCRLSGPDYN